MLLFGYDGTFQPKRDIFHRWCHVQNKMHCLIIDDESYANLASIALVSKLNLCEIKHDRSYRL